MGVPIRPRPTKAMHGTDSHYPAQQRKTAEEPGLAAFGFSRCAAGATACSPPTHSAPTAGAVARPGMRAWEAYKSRALPVGHTNGETQIMNEPYASRQVYPGSHGKS